MTIHDHGSYFTYGSKTVTTNAVRVEIAVLMLNAADSGVEAITLVTDRGADYAEIIAAVELRGCKVEVEAVVEASTAADTKEGDETLTPEQEKIARAAYGRLEAVRAEREKRQTAEAEARQLRDQMAQMQRQMQQAAAQNIPDPNYDPEGYARHFQQQLELARHEAEMTVIRDRMVTSDEEARERFGPEEVEAAAAWAKSKIDEQPHLQQVLFQQRKPLVWVVEQYQQARKLSEFVSDDEAYFKKMAEKFGYVPATSASVAPTTAVAPAAPATQVVAPNTAAPTLVNKTAPKRSALAATGGAPASTTPTGMMGILGLK